MISYRESDYMSETAIRQHPWKGSDYAEGIDYYDFRKNPELIREKLEDFKPWEKYEAIETFYQLLEFINSESSELEANDCAFTPPNPTVSTNTSPKKLECKGRLMVFYRRLPNNINPAAIQWFYEAVEGHIKHTDNSAWIDGIVGLSFMDTAYIECNNALGKEIVIQFWAFGDTEEETFQNLNRLLRNLTIALKGLSDEIAEAIQAQWGSKNESKESG